MLIPDVVLKWLMENAYAAKGDDYWFIMDFPSNDTPDRLHIPIKKHSWGQIRDKLGK